MQNPFDKYYKEYDRWYDENKFLYLSELNALKKAIGNFKYKNAVEIGVGSGRFAKALGIRNGIEPSNKMGKIAAERGIKVIKAFGENIPFPDKNFDMVLICFTLCFVQNSNQVLSEAKRILKNNGILLIGIIDRNTKLGKYYLRKKKKNKFYANAKFYSAKVIIEKIRKLGFTKIKTYQTLFLDPVKLKNLKQIDRISKGYGEGGFVAISAKF
ncbi:MAG: class I SAM-dependent methyltransferase [Elusimicrobiota bacterium]